MLKVELKSTNNVLAQVSRCVQERWRASVSLLWASNRRSVFLVRRHTVIAVWPGLQLHEGLDAIPHVTSVSGAYKVFTDSLSIGSLCSPHGMVGHRLVKSEGSLVSDVRLES